jgi:hypothetical protein
MPSNDEVVFGIPQIQCPSCRQILDVSGKPIEKFSKAQRKWSEESTQNQYATTSDRFHREPDTEDLPSAGAEKVLVVVTCANTRCEQYNKIKILKLPRIYTPSVKIDLSDLG